MRQIMACIAAVLAASACGDDSSDGATEGDGGRGGDVVQNPNASCDSTDYGFCTDYEGNAAALETACSASGTWSETVFCDPRGSCGSCTVDAGGLKATTYYFNGSGSESNSASVCANGRGRWRDVPSVTCN